MNTNAIYWGFVLGVSFLIALHNVIGSIRAEIDIKNGANPKDAIKYHRKMFHRKKDNEDVLLAKEVDELCDK